METKLGVQITFFIVISESSSKVKNIAVYRFLISFPVPELFNVNRFEKRSKKWYEKLRGLG